MSNVVLNIGGEKHEGWTEIQVRKSIEELCGAFELSLTDRWKDGQKPLAIIPGTKCNVTIDGEQVIDGYIDGLEFSYDAENHQIRVSGRDKAGDLIDCAIANGTGEWRNLKLEELISELVKPFGITVKTEVNTGDRIPKFNAEQGMTVFEAIKKLCALRGVLAISDRKGNIVITRTGKTKASTNLIEGENILTGSANYNFTERFSDYICKGQQKGTDNVDAKTATTHKSVVKDENVKRYRPTIIVADGQTDKGKTLVRAQWEAAVRRGKSRSFTITIHGWKDGKNKLWDINQKIKLTSQMLGVDEELLIASTTFKLNMEGEITELLVGPAEAYELVNGDKITAGDKWEKKLKSLGKILSKIGLK